MSAYIVSKEHIQYIVNAGLRFTASRVRWYTVPAGVSLHDLAPDQLETARHELRPDNASEVGQMLWDENSRSVDCRYRSRTHPEMLVFEHDVFSRHDFNPVQALKAIKCFEYQSCETADWENSEAYNFCQSLKNHLIQALPGYDTAKWEIN